MLNYPTLLLVQLSFTALTTLLLVAAALGTDALREQRLWAWGNVATCCGIALGSFTALPALVHGALSYAVMGFGISLVLKGLRLFCGLDTPKTWMAGVTTLSFLIPAYFVVVSPGLSERLLATGAWMGFLNLVCAISLWRNLHDTTRHVMWICVTGFTTLAAALLLRSVYLWHSPIGLPGEHAADAVMAFTLYAIPLAQVTIAFGLVMMVSHRFAEKLDRLTLMDGLTGALNRVGLERMAPRILLRSRQYKRNVCVAMFDADHFKVINDTYGHPAGDKVLQHLVELLSAQLRPGDLVVRYGGEEFLLVMDGLNQESGLAVTDRLRKLVEEDSIKVDGKEIRYQVSAGLACTEKHGYDLKHLIWVADSALYNAKQTGRNKVSVG